MIGDVAQVCKSTGLKFCVVQTSEEKAEMVMAHLGIETSTHDETSASECPMDTEELLETLSERGNSNYIGPSIINLASDNIWGYC